MGKLTKPHTSYSKWTDKDKQRAVEVYKSTRNRRSTADITGIPYDTLCYWAEQEWWDEAIRAAKQLDADMLEEAATSIAQKGFEAVSDRLEHGDVVLTKDGQLVRKPVSARDAALVTGIALSKRKELQEEPVRVQQLGTTERLLKLVEQFAKLANVKELKKDTEIIDLEALPEEHERNPETDTNGN